MTQPENNPQTSVRLRNYFRHLGATISEAPFTPGTWLYLVIVLVGVGIATWVIPYMNGSETSPETLGIYVIGILIPVFADALFLWKKSSDDVIAETIVVLSFLISFIAAYLSVKGQALTSDGHTTKQWRHHAEPLLFIFLVIAVIMWAMLNVVEPPLRNPATQEPPATGNLHGS